MKLDNREVFGLSVIFLMVVMAGLLAALMREDSKKDDFVDCKCKCEQGEKR